MTCNVLSQYGSAVQASHVTRDGVVTPNRRAGSKVSIRHELLTTQLMFHDMCVTLSTRITDVLCAHRHGSTKHIGHMTRESMSMQGACSIQDQHSKQSADTTELILNGTLDTLDLD